MAQPPSHTIRFKTIKVRFNRPLKFISILYTPKFDPWYFHMNTSISSIQYLFLFSLVSRCLHFVLSLVKSQYKLQKFAQFTKILRGIFASGILNILQQLRFSLFILLAHSCFNAYTLGWQLKGLFSKFQIKLYTNTSNICYLIGLRHVIRSRAVSEKTYFL